MRSDSPKPNCKSDTDRYGTGEAASADGDNHLEPDADILPDEVENDTRDLVDEIDDEEDRP